MIWDSNCTVDDRLTLWCAFCRARSSSCRCRWASPHPPRLRRASPPKWQWTGGCRPARHHQRSWNAATQGTSRSGCHCPVSPSEGKDGEGKEVTDRRTQTVQCCCDATVCYHQLLSVNFCQNSRRLLTSVVLNNPNLRFSMKEIMLVFRAWHFAAVFCQHFKLMTNNLSWKCDLCSDFSRASVLLPLQSDHPEISQFRIKLLPFFHV